MHQLVAPTSQYLALVEAGVAAKLAKMLVALCAGVHLDAVTNVARPTSSSTVDRLFALPNVTEAEVLSALGEDARAEEILGQARARRDNIM